MTGSSKIDESTAIENTLGRVTFMEDKNVAKVGVGGIEVEVKVDLAMQGLSCTIEFLRYTALEFQLNYVD